MISDLVTVVIPTRNRLKYLEITLASVFDKQGGAIPKVMVSDNSTHDVPEMGALRSKYAFTYVRQSGKLNIVEHHAACMSMPTTPWAFVLHDDDELSPNSLAKLEELLVKSVGVGAVIGGIEYVDELGMPRGSWVPHAAGMFKGEEIVLRLGLDHRACLPGIVLSVPRFHEVGGFPNTGEIPNDQVLVLKLAYSYGVVLCPEIIGRYRIWGSQTTNFRNTAGTEHMIETAISSAQALRNIGVSPQAADQLGDYTIWWLFQYVAPFFSKHPFFVFRMCRKCELHSPPNGVWRSRARREYPFLFWKPRRIATLFGFIAITLIPRRARQPLYSVLKLIGAKRDSQ